MIDTHCHLTDPRILSQLGEVLAKAQGAGVSRIVTIGTDLEDDRAAIALCRGRENLRCAIGIHPNHVKTGDLEQISVLRELQGEGSVVALGEMGLDYFHRFASRGLQAEVFEAQLRMAAEVGKPVVIHSRDAIEDTLAIMAKYPGVRGVFHCFTGTREEARRIVEAGYWVGFTGVVTFKKSEELREAVRETPMERLLVETDGPYLTPEPVRKQKVNEPAFVVHTAAEVARIKGVSLEEIDRVTTENAGRFFGWG